MNIIVDLNYPIKDGTEVKFRSPVDCSQVTGLVVHYDGGSQEFVFADAHGNNVGDIDHLFAEDVVVKVILDVTTGMAFVQNADTNAYLEGRFADLESKIGTGGGGSDVLIVTLEDPSLETTTTASHTATQIYEHVINGGCAILDLAGIYMALDIVIPEIATFAFHFTIGNANTYSMVAIDANGVATISQHFIPKEEEWIDMENRMESAENSIGDIETALDGIIAIQNELIGGDGV